MTPLEPADLGRFLTLADAAELLRVTPGEVLALVRSGELPAIAIGAARTWRVERVVLESYIEGLYEQTRRLSLWNQTELTPLDDFAAH